MIEGIIRGNNREANSADTKGWVAGHMSQGLAKTVDFEIKMWQYDKPFDYGRKVFKGTEFISIYGGTIQLELEKGNDGSIERAVVLLKGSQKEYVIIPAGITKRVVVIDAPAFGDTVRWPSDPENNSLV